MPKFSSQTSSSKFAAAGQSMIPPINGTRPSSIEDISESDRRQRSRKRQVIQQRWGCDIHEVIPAALRPRAGIDNRMKVHLGVDAPEAPWWSWSTLFYQRLDSLAALTPRNLPYVQNFMEIEVKNRHNDWTNRYKDTAEVLVQDLERVIKFVEKNPPRRRNANGEFESTTDEEGGDESGDDDDDQEEDEEEYEEEDRWAGRVKEGPFEEDAASSPQSRPEPGAADMAALQTEQAALQRSATSPLPAPRTKMQLETMRKIANLRADAMRLKQEMAKREAEAYELEAKMLMIDAKGLQ